MGKPFTVADVARVVGNKKGLFVLRVEHDDTCPTLRTNRGEDCNCSPDYKLVQMPSAGKRGAQ